MLFRSTLIQLLTQCKHGHLSFLTFSDISNPSCFHFLFLLPVSTTTALLYPLTTSGLYFLSLLLPSTSCLYFLSSLSISCLSPPSLQVRTWRGMTSAQRGLSSCQLACTGFWERQTTVPGSPGNSPASLTPARLLRLAERLDDAACVCSLVALLYRHL